MGKPAEKQIARRQDVTRAALRVIARDGFARASMRAIAAELGATVGVLTHYFPHKEALLRLMVETVDARLAAAFEAAPMERLSDLRTLLGLILPTGPEQQDVWKVWLSFAVAGADRPALAPEHGHETHNLVTPIAAALARLDARGELRPNLDLAAEAQAIGYLMDGLGLHGALMPDQMPAARQLAILNGRLDGLAPRG